MSEPLLALRNVEVVYQRVVTAVQGVSLDVQAGSIVGLIGVNGAGKTTTLRAISGFLDTEQAKITEGEIVLDGQSLVGRAPHQNARMGVLLVPERDKVFDHMTVTENLRLATRGRNHEDAFVYFPRLASRRATETKFLSGGEKQMLALASAFLASPRVLLVDELSLGLAPAVVAEVMERLVQLHEEEHLTMLLVDQNVGQVLRVADHGYVIENGRIVFSGSRQELLSHGDIREFYLSGSGASSYAVVKQYRRTRRWWT